jgi:hypothetical protein
VITGSAFEGERPKADHTADAMVGKGG